MSNNNTCIWCSRPTTDKDLEHIFPEALGCSAHLTLPGTVVCRRCNMGLAPLDQSFLIDLSPSQKFIPVIRAKLLETQGTDGWTMLPTAS